MISAQGCQIADNVVIQVEGLVKRFGEFTAVSGIDFTVETGEIFGFLGPNGAGKSTTIKMLATLLRPTSGTAWRPGTTSSRMPRACGSPSGWCFRTRRWTNG